MALAVVFTLIFYIWIKFCQKSSNLNKQIVTKETRILEFWSDKKTVFKYSESSSTDDDDDEDEDSDNGNEAILLTEILI